AELCRLFYEEAVRPIMERRFPGLKYGAARLEAGSEVLGFDTATSMDHSWGLRVTLFITRAAWTPALATDIKDVMAAELPFELRGLPTHFTQSSSITTPSTQRPINHGVKLADAPRLLHAWLNMDVLGAWPPHTAEWLTAPEHHLRTVVCGPVYRDDTGELAIASQRLRWYPHDVWLYLLASVWQRIAQEEAFPGHCGDVGDEAGSLIITGRLVRDVVRLGLLMERQYAPYAKWLGTAFARLACAPRLTPLLLGTLKADTWPERDRHLADAYETLAAMHNALGVTPPLDPSSGPRYPERPYLTPADGACTSSGTAGSRGARTRAGPSRCER
ncbi:MAG: DUF4037 domain-containing protein, partial [Chloroflexota bacterium]|nr:DUF4037 domain-containing protein [Chloroflexota bacterium]